MPQPRLHSSPPRNSYGMHIGGYPYDDGRNYYSRPIPELLGSLPINAPERPRPLRFKPTAFHALAAIGVVGVFLAAYMGLSGRNTSESEMHRPYPENRHTGREPYIRKMDIRQANPVMEPLTATASIHRSSPNETSLNISNGSSQTPEVLGPKVTYEELFSFPTPVPTTLYRVACVFNHTSYRRKEPMSFRVGHIPGPYCSHVVYYSIGIASDFSLQPRDKDFDVVRDGFNKFAHLKRIYPHLSVLIAIGGLPSDSKLLSDICHTQEAMAAFAVNVQTWLSRYEYDGILLDWRTYTKSFRSHMRSLLEVLRQAFGPSYSIWLAVPNDHELRKRYFNVARVSQYVDKFFVIPEVTQSKLTNTPLVPDLLNDVLDVRHHLVTGDGGKLYNKFCFAMHIGGRSYTLVQELADGSNAVVSDYGIRGPYTDYPGLLAYYEFCNANWSVRTHGAFESYMSEGRQWVGYLDVPNIVKVLKMALWKHRASCVGVWDVSLDDFRGVCGERFVLTRAVAGWKAYGRSNAGLFEK
ncbi:endochitinase-like [Ornithodoros turicata]|uniref:endochitinase-like n=1 Tax=Ornithodoros turicata TaxID=34597 RepID=UPI00313A15F3